MELNIKGKQTIKVLLVDDEEDFVTSMSERMRIRELGSDVVFTGEAAIESLDQQVPDVMVVDLNMPGIDGLEVLRQVKRMAPQVEVILLTGHGSDKDERAARRLGAFEYLRKPVDLEELVRNIRRAYEIKQTRAV